MDLSAAYRQLCMSEESKLFSYVAAVYDPELKQGRPFRQISLPFGSKAAVNAFIRCARCIQWFAARCLFIVPVTCYFDDFIIVWSPELSVSAEAGMGLLLQLMGWAYDTTGPKADTFSAEICALRVLFNLAETKVGLLTLDNREKRKKEVAQLVRMTLESNNLSKKEAQSLRGRLAFAYSQVFGRAGQLALQQISLHASSTPFRQEMRSSLRDALRFLESRIAQGVPRKIMTSVHDTVYILTDASFDDDKTGLGGILFNGDGAIISWFTIMLSESQVQKFIRGDAQVVIGELEALAPVMAVD